MTNGEAPKYVEIGKRIKEYREKEGLTQADLANKLGYGSPTFISLIEAGDRKIRIDDLEKVAKILHASFEYLVHGHAASVPTIQMALRADKSLDHSDVKTIEQIISALKGSKGTRDGQQ